ncbi:hypothetical protein OESDEN_03277 [Oesophagostomum dentatum]|uniref:CX domain-containing protein n=1 Tax=Oesophagostomum dentatum TaxID=61180 RepID=A0A0B1TLR4_OESDE|nr:hypothetical protein OESDEN_03277 [Oesophagostomum dentatum]
MTFYFENSLLFDPVPIFVVGEDQLGNWRPDFPDETYALTKISHECEVGQRACGLKCCQKETFEIQKGFLELARDENLPSGTTYFYNDVKYSLEVRDNSSIPECSYDLSFYDILARRGKTDGKPISTIYFSCPEKHTCCGLSCLPSPEIALLRKPRRVEVFSFKFDQRKKNILLMTGAALAFIAFVVITALNYRNASKCTNSSKARSTRRSVDTQTSSISLHLDADSRTLLRGSHLV